MSHITKRKSAMMNPDTLKKAVERTSGAKWIGRTGRARGAREGGYQFKLQGWSQPVTVDTSTGECIFDNYGGRWGSESELDKIKQGYAVEAAKAQATVEGHEFEEQQLSNGSIKCTISLGGSAGYEAGEGDGSGWDV